MSLIPRSFYLDDIFDDLGRGALRVSEMKCDVYEENGIYNIEMDIPGYEKNDIKIECNDGVLVVTAEKNNVSNEESNNKKYIRRERVYGKISRTFNFSDIDEDSIKAEFTNGILKISIPKLEKNQTKKVIEIN